MTEAPTVESLLNDLRNGSWEVRTEASRQLREWQSEKAPAQFFEAIHEADLSVRLAVVEALANYVENDVIEALEEALFDEEWEVQWAAMCSLGTLWKEPELRKMGNKLPEKRISGIESVAQKSGPHLLKPLLASLDDEIEEVQAAGVRALAARGDNAALPHLRKLLKSSDPELKALIAESLSQLGDPTINEEGQQYLLACDECGHKLPPSYLHRVCLPQSEARHLCQFHFDAHQEQILPFEGKLKACKLCKTHWPKVACIEGACPACRDKRYQALPPLSDDQFRCYRCHKQRPPRDLSPASTRNEPLCSKCAYQLAQTSANTPFLTPQAIQLLEYAFDQGYLLCEKCRNFQPLDLIVEGYDFRDHCVCQPCKR